MLVQVRIQNYALIDDIRIEFASGLNVLTGETGAGKSILIDALRLCFGERAETIPFKNSSQPCFLEAVVDYPAIRSLLGDIKASALFSDFLEEGDDLISFRREFPSPGKSRSLVNGRLVNLSQIRSLAEHLVDWHGQYDFQSIFQPSAQLDMLDRYAKSEKLLSEYAELYEEYAGLLEAKTELENSVQNRDDQIDLLKFQTQEIDRIKPKPGEDDALKSDWIRFSHAEKLNVRLSEILEALDEGEQAASGKIGGAFKALNELERIDPEFSKKREVLEGVQAGLEEWLRDMRDYRDSLSFDEDAAREAEERLHALDVLKKKYGGTIEAVRQFCDSAKKKLAQLEDSELSFKELEKNIQKSRTRVLSAGSKLSDLRRDTAKKFSKKICSELEELGMKQAVFSCRLEKSEPSPRGCDDLQFYLAPNAGLSEQPLSRIASGGEASRVMLAIKKVAGDSDRIATLVFDEIDANIGGRLGSIVGQKLREISRDHQVLLITHLPQIAAFADRHLKVVKASQAGKTKISYLSLDREGRVSELAQMMSGQEETAISVKHAKELLSAASAAGD